MNRQLQNSKHTLVNTPIRSRPRQGQVLCGAIVLAAALLGGGCQVLSYSGPNGERFSRSSLGARTAIASLTVQADTNGVRKVELRGYTNDPTQALGVVTEAAVRAALQK